MKSLAPVLAFGLFAAVQAQEQCAVVAAKIPTCAIQCIDKAAASAGCDDPTDFTCQCKNTEAINSGALNCVLSGCGAQTGLAVQASASAVCACVSSAGSSSPTTTEAASSPAKTSAVPTGPGPEVSAGSSAVIASPAPPPTSAAPYPTQISDGQVQAGTAVSPSGTGAVTPSSPASFTGAGVRTVASVGGILAAFAAFMVAL